MNEEVKTMRQRCDNDNDDEETAQLPVFESEILIFEVTLHNTQK
jgi:hypothetical protein